MKSTKNLSCNMTFFGIATHIPLRQRKPLLPPLVKVVENIIILIWMPIPLTLLIWRLWERRLQGSMRSLVKGAWLERLKSMAKRRNKRGPQYKQGRCRRTDQFIRVQVQWRPTSGRTVILAPHPRWDRSNSCNNHDTQCHLQHGK